MISKKFSKEAIYYVFFGKHVWIYLKAYVDSNNLLETVYTNYIKSQRYTYPLDGMILPNDNVRKTSNRTPLTQSSTNGICKNIFKLLYACNDVRMHVHIAKSK